MAEIFSSIFPLWFEGLFGFLFLFCIFHLIFKKPIKFKPTLIILFFFGLNVCIKGLFGVWLANLDQVFHISYEGFYTGFPLFFFFKYLINFVLNSFYWLPLLFGTATAYVFCYWVSKKQVNLFTLCLLLYFFQFNLLFFFSFSREPIVFFFGLLCFYFLEKWYSNLNLKDLLASFLFLVLACLSKLTGVFLLPFFVFILLKKAKDKRVLYGLIALCLVFSFYLLLTTNLFSNLSIFSINFNFLLIQGFFYAFPLLFLVFFPPFINPKNFFWLFAFYFFILFFVLGLKSNTFYLIFNETHFDYTIRRYALIFLLPFILWLSIEINSLIKKIKDLIWVKQ